MLAIIAGSGHLPAIVAHAAQENARPYIAALDGHLPSGVSPDVVFRIETLGTLIENLLARGVTDVCFAGAVRRPPVDPEKIDAATMPLVPRLLSAIQKGDDGALREILAIFEEAGMRIRGASDLVPALLPEVGIRSQASPDEHMVSDVARAADVLATIGTLDIGQACVVHRGQVLAIEGSFGTDWMLSSLVERPAKDPANGPSSTGGVFYKAAKPGQDRRIDLPVIGVETIQAAKRAGLDGVAVEAGSVMVLDQAAVSNKADALGLFFWVRAS
ncbi:MAG: UDP-2,3-diacylglucosamine diphosphatase LpxI [Pseudomonadota bacterium]